MFRFIAHIFLKAVYDMCQVLHLVNYCTSKKLVVWSVVFLYGIWGVQYFYDFNRTIHTNTSNIHIPSYTSFIIFSSLKSFSYLAAWCTAVISHFFSISSKQISMKCFSGAFYENATLQQSDMNTCTHGCLTHSGIRRETSDILSNPKCMSSSR